MSKSKVAVTIESKLLQRIDRLVADRVFPSRSQAIEAALTEKLERLEQTRLARECARLDPREEVAMAEEGLELDLASWPEY